MAMIPANRAARWLLGVALGSICGTAFADHDHGNQALTFFVSAEDTQRSGDVPPNLDSAESDVYADILTGLRHERWRLLSEFVLSPEEHEFERLQLGYEASDNTVIWIGRYHQPASVWNVFYHHGQYLQTSVTRPWIENWEDEDGTMPQHIIGTLVESHHSLGSKQGLRVSAGVGMAPTLRSNYLQPFDEFFHRNNPTGSYMGARIEWLPDAIGEDTIGLIGSHAEVRAVRPDMLFDSHLDYSVYGAFFSLSAGASRAIGAFYRLELNSEGPSPEGPERHVSWYLQYDYSLTSQLTLFARQEDTSGTAGSLYLAQFPNVLARRSLAGFRWQLPHKNALSLEISRNTDRLTHLFTESRIQWSAALP